jgi:Domain of unknown function (DUF4314)
MAKRGDRVRLLSTSDPHMDLEEGAEGTVEFVDDMGTVHVRFDDGTTLGAGRGRGRLRTRPAGAAPSRWVRRLSYRCHLARRLRLASRRKR